MNEMNDMAGFIQKVPDIPPCGVFKGVMAEETRKCREVLKTLEIGETVELNLQRRWGARDDIPKNEIAKWSGRCKTAANHLLPKKFKVAIRQTNVYVRRIE